MGRPRVSKAFARVRAAKMDEILGGGGHGAGIAAYADLRLRPAAAPADRAVHDSLVDVYTSSIAARARSWGVDLEFVGFAGGDSLRPCYRSRGVEREFDSSRPPSAFFAQLRAFAAGQLAAA